MRALRYHGVQDLRLDDDVPEPQCLEHQVKVAPAFVGICGTDLHEYWSPTFIPLKDHPHPVTKESVPVGLGHEFSGTIVEIGSRVQSDKGLKIGDHVAVQPTICCLKCSACEDGFLNCCDAAGFVGLSGGGGGLSDYVCVDASFIHKLPTEVPLDIGALVEPLAVAWHAVDQYDIKIGDEALVLGAGPIGLGIIQCLQARGAKTIIVAEVSKERQNFAREFGATHILDPGVDNVVSKTREICGGRHGSKVAFDCAGVPASIKTAVQAVRARGTIVNVAIWEKEIPFQPNSLVFGEKKYLAVLGYLGQDFQGVIKALGDGSLRPRKMITSKIRIDRVYEDGFKALMEEKDNHVKILVDLKT